MIERVLLVAWKGSTATGWVDILRSGGYTVLLEDTTGERAWRTAKERGIDCVIIDGQKKPSHGRQTGHSLRDTAKTRDIPIIWTNLDPDDAAGVQADVHPDRTLPAPTDALGALVALQSLAAERGGEPAEESSAPSESVTSAHEPSAPVEAPPPAPAVPKAAREPRGKPSAKTASGKTAGKSATRPAPRRK